MAKTTIRNISGGARGVRTADHQLVMIERGESAEIDLTAAERKDAEATGYFVFDDAAEADPNDLNSLKKADLIAIAEAENVAVETDDNRSELIRKISEAREAKA